MADTEPESYTEPGYEVDGVVYLYLVGDSGPFGGHPFLDVSDLEVTE